MPNVLIFDDDPTVTTLLSGLIRALGLSVDAYLSGAGVMQMTLETRPKLLILDIMMPGMDGLSACRALRAHPAARGVKIIILTAKRFAQDRESAARYGADAFFSKPFDLGELQGEVKKLLGLPAAKAAGPQLPAGPSVAVRILPGALVLEAGPLWVFCDAGAGLARFLAAKSAVAPECWLLISRYESSTLTEFDALAQVMAKGARLKIMAPDDPDGSLQRLAPRLSRLLSGRVTPLLYPQREGEFVLAPGIQGLAQYTQYPGQTLAYRINFGAKGIVWCPAHEISSDESLWRGHEMDKFRHFFTNAELLMYGCPDEAATSDKDKREIWERVLDLAAESRVRRLALFPRGGALAESKDLNGRLSQRVQARGYALKTLWCRGAETFNL